MKIPRPIQERRRAIRIAESLPFHISGQGFEIEAKTLNISATGALCRVSKNIPLMTQLKIGLVLPHHSKSSSQLKTLYLKGVVVRKEVSGDDPDVYDIALFFPDIRAADRKLLDAFIVRSHSAGA